jgi:hypothetical protein
MLKYTNFYLIGSTKVKFESLQRLAPNRPTVKAPQRQVHLMAQYLSYVLDALF